jgi:hypothetical protein
LRKVRRKREEWKRHEYTSVVDPHWAGFKCGSGSSILGQCGSGSSSAFETRDLMTKDCKILQIEKKIHIFKKI